MTDDNLEPTVRKALDAVNTSRKWALLGIASLFFAITLALAVLSTMVTAPSTQQGIAVDVPSVAPDVAATAPPPVVIGRVMPVKALWLSAAMQLFFVACGTTAVILHVSKMTRAVLRAIEAKKQP